MGQVDSALLSTVEAELAANFGAATKRIELNPPDFAFDPRRAQYGAVPILRELAA